MDKHKVNLQALRRELGTIGMVRFLQLFEQGSGDYSRDRHQLLPDLDSETLFKLVREQSTLRG